MEFRAPTLGKDFSEFFTRIYNERASYVLSNHLTETLQNRINKILEKLKAFLNYKWSDKQAATFITEHKADLRMLICPNSNLSLIRLDCFIIVAKDFNY